MTEQLPGLDDVQPNAARIVRCTDLRLPEPPRGEQEETLPGL
ncbi:hypothetical protein [Streptacidiphilus fuscans]|nr:hypothetical protein [Streptacidiphilus fuscans]